MTRELVAVLLGGAVGFIGSELFLVLMWYSQTNNKVYTPNFAGSSVKTMLAGIILGLGCGLWLDLRARR